MTSTQILGRALRHMTCLVEEQENVSPRGQTATRNGVHPVVAEKRMRRALRVLVHGHHPDAADMMARQVRDWGHTATWASNEVVALHLAAACQPDVVLLNLESSLSDGFRLTRELRRRFEKNECLLIAFTNLDDDDCRQQCQAAGIDVVFVRPVEPSVVETLLLLECVNVNRKRAKCMENDQLPEPFDQFEL